MQEFSKAMLDNLVPRKISNVRKDVFHRSRTYGEQFGQPFIPSRNIGRNAADRLCETEWNDREASRRKSIFCSSSRMCKGIRWTRGWKIDGATWNSFDFDCFRRIFNTTAAKLTTDLDKFSSVRSWRTIFAPSKEILYFLKRIISRRWWKLRIFIFLIVSFSSIVSLNDCCKSENFFFSRRKGIIIIFSFISMKILFLLPLSFENEYRTIMMHTLY